MKRRKYGNVKVALDGHTFDSKAECARYGQLKLLLRAGAIRDLELQPSFRIAVNGVKVCDYRGDFRYVDAETGETVIEDVKGVRTPTYRLKAKLMLAVHGIAIREV